VHTTIDVRLTVSIGDDKSISLATLAEFITDQNIESVLLETFVESLDAPASRHSVVNFGCQTNLSTSQGIFEGVIEQFSYQRAG